MKNIIASMSVLALILNGCGSSQDTLSSLQAEAPATFQPPDPGLLQDPYVVMALKYHQANYKGALELNAMTPLVSPGATPTYKPVPVSGNKTSLAEIIHAAWGEQGGTACQSIQEQILQEGRRQFPEASLTDVQCSINPRAVHGVKFNRVVQGSPSSAGREQHLLNIRLLNQSNFINFTMNGVKFEGIPINPRFLISFNLSTDIDISLSRGHSQDAGKPLVVKKAVTSAWNVKVSSGNVGGHVAQLFANANVKIADGINRNSQDITGKIAGKFNDVLKIPLPIIPFLRSELTDQVFQTGKLPFLVLPSRPLLAPRNVAVKTSGRSMHITWVLPDTRPADLDKVIVVRKNDGATFGLGPKENNLYVEALPNQTNSFEVCALNEWGERSCSGAASAAARGPAVLPNITMVESDSSVTFSWPAWSDANAQGQLTVSRDSGTPTSFPLFQAGTLVETQFAMGGGYDYEFCVNSDGYGKTCKTFRFYRPGAYRSGLVRPMHLSSTAYCAGVGGSGTADGTPLVIWDCIPDLQDQQFSFWSDNSMRDSNSNKCLTVVGDGPTRDIVIMSCTGQPNQQWRKDFDYSSNVVNVGTGLCMYVAGDTLASPRNRVVATSCSQSKGYLWYFIAPLY